MLVVGSFQRADKPSVDYFAAGMRVGRVIGASPTGICCERGIGSAEEEKENGDDRKECTSSQNSAFDMTILRQIV